MTKTIDLELRQVRIDGGTQTRAQLDEPTIAEYAEALAAGASFPPAVVFFDGAAYWLADGFHRVEAHRRAGRTAIAVEVRQGTRRDAVLYSAGANATHGLRRTAADRRRAVETLLRDEGWSQWSNRELAQRARVPESLVRALRDHAVADVPSIPGACGIEVGAEGVPAGWVVLIVESTAHPGYYWIQVVNLAAPVDEDALVETTKPVRRDAVRALLEHLDVPIDRLTWMDAAPEVLPLAQSLADPALLRAGALS